jgi:RNA polymerase sigma-70 factor (ECF subfamily)
MSHQSLQAEQFEQHRPQLQAVAYRMLGSVGEAEDAVQEAWLRLNRSDADAIGNLGGWLTTVVGRVCIDMLRARRARHEDHMPEPIVAADESEDPEREALLADSVGLALLVVLETLSPAERLAFVLHDMFAVPFDEIAPMVDRTPAAARQLASRARRRVRGAAPAPDADFTRQREIVAAFLAASRAGDFDALVGVLAPDAVFRLDGRPAATGIEKVAELASVNGPRYAAGCRIGMVNGAPGIVVHGRRGLRAVAGFTIAGDRIVTIDLIRLDPRGASLPA